MSDPQSSDLIQTQIDSLVRIVKKHSEIAKLILFGSSARNQSTVGSDIDVLILVKNGEVDIDMLTLLIRKETFETLSFPLDIVVESLATFEARKRLPTLERTIDREGVVLYAA